MCREAVFGDLSSSPQICLEGVRSIFVTFRTPFNYSNVWFLFFNVQISRYSHCFTVKRICGKGLKNNDLPMHLVTHK